MTRMTSPKALLRNAACGALLAAGLFAAAAPAEATPVWVRDGNGGTVFNGGPGYVNLSIRVDGNNQSVSAGAFALQYGFSPTGPFTDFLTYCLEPDELLNVGATPTAGTLRGTLSETAEYAARANDLTRLWNTWFADSLTDATKSAAFQVALWEVAYDGGGSLASGSFQLNTTGAVKTQAMAYLDQANWISPAGAEPGVILRVGSQDLTISVPVPAPAALGLFGIGLIGLALGVARRRTMA